MNSRVWLCAAFAALAFVACSEEESSTLTPPADLPENAFFDSRDGHIYGTVTIDNHVWMTSNMNFDTKRTYISDSQKDSVISVCANNDCDTYGRLYSWAAAKLACPTGWRFPTEDDWENLKDVLSTNFEDLSTLLESTTGWEKQTTEKQDLYGFNIIPAGHATMFDDTLIFYPPDYKPAFGLARKCLPTKSPA